MTLLSRPALVRLWSVIRDETGVIGSVSLRGWFDEKLVEMIALVATRAARSLCSASKLLSFAYEVKMKPSHSALRHSNGGSVLLRRSGDRDLKYTHGAGPNTRLSCSTSDAVVCPAAFSQRHATIVKTETSSSEAPGTGTAA